MPGDLITEYGGVVRTYEEVGELRDEMQHTHIKAIYERMSYFDSRWSNGPAVGDIPAVSDYLEGHYLAGFMNAAYFKVLILDILKNSLGFIF